MDENITVFFQLHTWFNYPWYIFLTAKELMKIYIFLLNGLIKIMHTFMIRIVLKFTTRLGTVQSFLNLIFIICIQKVISILEVYYSVYLQIHSNWESSFMETLYMATYLIYFPVYPIFFQFYTKMWINQYKQSVINVQCSNNNNEQYIT